MYPFFVLGVNEKSTQKEIDDQYHALIKNFPPDRSPEYFRLIKEAYDAIKDPIDRIKESIFYQSTHSPKSFIEAIEVINKERTVRLSPIALKRLID
ncbi:DnaJ domain-containing protein, partial [Myxococcota bacterium]|nr:DnaJ domain-containing protein [Myxococcota bacterium]